MAFELLLIYHQDAQLSQVKYHNNYKYTPTSNDNDNTTDIHNQYKNKKNNDNIVQAAEPTYEKLSPICQGTILLEESRYQVDILSGVGLWFFLHTYTFLNFLYLLCLNLHTIPSDAARMWPSMRNLLHKRSLIVHDNLLSQWTRQMKAITMLWLASSLIYGLQYQSERF